MAEEIKSIVQDTRVLQALFGKIPEEGNVINIFNIGQYVSGDGNGKQERKSIDLIAFLESLHQPRLKNLNEMVMAECIEKFGTQERAAKFLGITRRILNYNLGQNQEKILLSEEVEK